MEFVAYDQIIQSFCVVDVSALSILVVLLTGCLANDDSFVSISEGGAANSVSSIQMLVSSPQLGSSGANTVTVTAIAKDASNVALANVPVTFSADSGSLTVANDTTDDSGQVTATLSTGNDSTNRTITVTASAGNASGSVTVDVTGTSLAVNGESSVIVGDPVTLTLP